MLSWLWGWVIANLFNGAKNFAETNALWAPDNFTAPSGAIDRDTIYAGQFAKMLFDQPGAGGAGDIAYIESNTEQPLICVTNIVSCILLGPSLHRDFLQRSKGYFLQPVALGAERNV